MAMDEKGLGKQLQKARQKAGLTQQQLCQRANLSFSTLTKIERGAIKSPSIFTIQSIGVALGMSLDELVGHSVSSTPARNLLKTRSGATFIYFDVNGCLVHFFQRAFASLAEETGASADSIETAFWHYNDEVCRGVITLDEFNKKMAEHIGAEEVNWQKHYLDTIEPIQEMHDVVKWASEHYKIGLMSNIMPGFLDEMRNKNILPNVKYDVIIDSSEVGALKPEEKIFELAQERAGVPANEILLIDDARVNLMAAGKMNWHVLWFDDSRSEESVDRVKTALEPAD